MIEFICLFFPAFISVGIFQKLIKNKLNLINLFSVYSIFNLAINGFVFLIKTYILGTGESLLIFDIDMTPSIALNYLIMAVPASVIFSIIFTLCYKNIELKIEKDDKIQ